MIQPSHTLITPEEYLALEEKSRDKHEYWHGEIFLMAGASRRHNIIAGNTYVALRAKLAQKPYEIYTADVRLHIEKYNAYTIPSLEHYIMIDQTQPYIEAYRREGRFWMLETLEGLDAVLKLRALDMELALSEIYARIDWSEE